MQVVLEKTEENVEWLALLEISNSSIKPQEDWA